MKDYKQIEHMRNLNDSLIWERMKRCYDYGYEDGQKEKLANAMIHDHEVAEKTAYEQGLNDAWECSRKMCLMSPEERLRAFDVSGNHLAILSDLTASESIEKLKAHEEKQKQTEDIKVGDEVIVQVDRIGFVTGFDVLFDRVYVTTKDGWSDAFGRSFVKKTGRHFDAIPEVLKQMNREEDK